MSRLCVYYRPEPERDRWLPGDRWVRPIVRRVIRGKRRPGGIDRVFLNLCAGLKAISAHFVVNLPVRKLRSDDRVVVLGRGRHSLRGFPPEQPLVAGIGLMTHPSEWPDLFQTHRVATYLQHSDWCAAIYRRWYGGRCHIWPVGIDTAKWAPAATAQKTVDYLIYDKILWSHPEREADLLNPILGQLEQAGLSWERVTYGAYRSEDYAQSLARCRAMIFLSAHESQGIAYQEAMSTDVPIFAWDPGFVQDPQRFAWGEPVIPATSVPYFDASCGDRFHDYSEFAARFDAFHANMRQGAFSPRQFVLKHLTLEHCSTHLLQVVDESLAALNANSH